MTEEQDHITVVLRECEERLRDLASRGRLSSEALSAFMELTTQVQRETDRRAGGERRATERLSADRRLAEVKASAASV